MRWESVLAAAAAIVIAIGLWHGKPAEKPPERAAAVKIVGPTWTPVAPVKRARKKRPPAEPLRVKMFTSDPDVVIYWIVDKKEGIE
jgi:hypothetical protein